MMETRLRSSTGPRAIDCSPAAPSLRASNHDWDEHLARMQGDLMEKRSRCKEVQGKVQLVEDGQAQKLFGAYSLAIGSRACTVTHQATTTPPITLSSTLKHRS